MRAFFILTTFYFLALHAIDAVTVEGRVLKVMPNIRSLELELTQSGDAKLEVGSMQIFRVGAGDIKIGYSGRKIKANATYYGKKWNLEQIFPIDGLGAKAARDVNHQLNQATATMSRRKYVKQGEYIPNFAMIDQHGEFRQIRQLQGKPFVLNFIFTRCTIPTMCPASSMRMADMQDAFREAGVNGLHFVSITFDPAFDSPGILNQYADGYGMESENFHLLTMNQSVVDDVLRQFGILTMEEDGTINHTMATLLVDANGRVAYRKEGTTWSTKDFMEVATNLL